MTFTAELSLLRQPDGSCYIRSDKTAIWCSVNGPGDIQSSKRFANKMNILFCIKRISDNTITEIGRSSNQKTSNFFLNSPPSTAFIEAVVRSTVDVDAYPRTVLQVCAQEIKFDTPFESALLNGICLALLDAGLQMHYPFAALTVVKLRNAEKNGASDADVDRPQFMVEPSRLRAAEAVATFLFVFRPSITADGGGTVVASNARGRFTYSDFVEARRIAQSQCLTVFNLYRASVSAKFKTTIVQ